MLHGSAGCGLRSAGVPLTAPGASETDDPLITDPHAYPRCTPPACLARLVLSSFAGLQPTTVVLNGVVPECGRKLYSLWYS